MTTQIDTPGDHFLVEPERRDAILRQAAEHRLTSLLTRSTGCGWQTYRTRFIRCQREQGIIHIEQPVTAGTDALERNATIGSATPLELLPGENIGVSFRRGHAKCTFTTMVVRSGPIVAPWPDNAWH